MRRLAAGAVAVDHAADVEIACVVSNHASEVTRASIAVRSSSTGAAIPNRRAE
jgi:hypothetical protein